MSELEHRIFTRLEFKLGEDRPDVAIANIEGDSRYDLHQLHDLSATGLSLSLALEEARNLEIGKIVKVSIDGFQDENLSTLARVVRRRRNFDTFDIGLKFESLPLFMRDAINSEIQKILVKRQTEAVKTEEPNKTKILIKKIATTSIVASLFGFVYGALNNQAPDISELYQIIFGQI